jgi:hypothetical protein
MWNCNISGLRVLVLKLPVKVLHHFVLWRVGRLFAFLLETLSLACTSLVSALTSCSASYKLTYPLPVSVLQIWAFRWKQSVAKEAFPVRS